MLGWFKKKFKKDKKENQAEIIEPNDPLDDPKLVEQAEGELVESDQKGKESEPVDIEVLEPEDNNEDPESEPEPETDADSLQPSTEEDKDDPVASEKEPVPEKKAGLFSRLKEKLVKTRGTLVNRLDAIFLGKKVIDGELLEELEEVLITADLGVQTVQELLDKAKAQLKRNELADPQMLYKALKENIYAYLKDAHQDSELVMPDSGPFVIMVLGVNGVGKTTSIGKMAHKFKESGQKVLLVAADTFRAAAIDQLKIWADRVGVEITAQKQGADPSAVVYDAMAYAKNHDFDVIIVDTAGRIHTKVNLMEELKKIRRVMGKHLPGAPHEVMLVLDSTTGQNAVSQAIEFNKAVDLTGLTMTKLDGTAKGGIIVNISRTLNIPIRFIGIGEQMDDLRDFHPKEFIEALFAK